MPYRPELHHRRSIRLKSHDYSGPAHYHVILNTVNGLLLSQIIETDIRLNESGTIVEKNLHRLAQEMHQLRIDTYAIMPNHLHVLLELKQAQSQSLSLGSMVGKFKTLSTRDINLLENTPGKKRWHRNYFEKLLSHPDAIHRTRQYILANPENWNLGKSPRK